MTNTKTMTIRGISLTAAAMLSWTLAGETASAQSKGPVPVYMHDTWVALKTQTTPGKRVYRRYSIAGEASLANVMMLQCPKDSGKYVHSAWK